jgi:cell division transport system permease protein
MLSVSFATRGAMATNRPIIEVLHYVGATDSFIGSQFRRHFLLLGFKGGAIGGGAAMLLFGLASTLSNWLAGTPSGEEAAALFGTFAMGAGGYVTILGQIAVMALVTAFASHRTVKRTLESIE